MRIRFLLLLAVLAALLAAVPAAQAIIGGTPDDGAHPYVAAISDGSTVCSGAAISPTVVVTAAHCFTISSEPTRVRVIFDENYRSPDRTLRPGSWTAYSRFCGDCGAVNDVAVVVLDEPVALPRYAELPSLGLVDRLGGHADVELVGYGVQEVVHDRRDFVPVPASGFRMKATAELFGIPKSGDTGLVKITARQQGAACFGDSGGPVLIGDTIVAVNSFASSDSCRGKSYAQRVDVPAIQSFLAGF
jgi:secreted trypsin-like serine protease